MPDAVIFSSLICKTLELYLELVLDAASLPATKLNQSLIDFKSWNCLCTFREVVFKWWPTLNYIKYINIEEIIWANCEKITRDDSKQCDYGTKHEFSM